MMTQIKAHKQEEATFSEITVVTMINLTMKSLLKTWQYWTAGYP